MRMFSRPGLGAGVGSADTGQSFVQSDGPLIALSVSYVASTVQMRGDQKGISPFRGTME
jgi:hypothetical protein